jgi:hypothetical protein
MCIQAACSADSLLALPSDTCPSPTSPPRRYIDMVARDKDDPRNKDDGEMGPGGVRMVVEKDLFEVRGMLRFHKQMLAQGNPMFEELSKMKVSLDRIL